MCLPDPPNITTLNRPSRHARREIEQLRARNKSLAEDLLASRTGDGGAAAGAASPAGGSSREDEVASLIRAKAHADARALEAEERAAALGREGERLRQQLSAAQQARSACGCRGIRGPEGVRSRGCALCAF
jgi:hypothetical protein